MASRVEWSYVATSWGEWSYVGNATSRGELSYVADLVTSRGGTVLRCGLLETFCSVPKMQDKTVLEVCVFATNLLGFCVILFGFDRYIAYCIETL